MKKISLFLSVLFLVALSYVANAQSAPDYFVGKWSVLVKGTPSGDSKMLVTLERKDGKLTGAISAEGQSDSIKLSNVEEKETSATVYFTANGYDVYILMNKKDDDHVIGDMMGMFDATGERVKVIN